MEEYKAMARGKRKTIDEKIQVQQEVVDAMKIRLQKEVDELELLKNEKKLQEVESLHNFILEAELTSEEAIGILQDHVKS